MNNSKKLMSVNKLISLVLISVIFSACAKNNDNEIFLFKESDPINSTMTEFELVIASGVIATPFQEKYLANLNSRTLTFESSDESQVSKTVALSEAEAAQIRTELMSIFTAPKECIQNGDALVGGGSIMINFKDHDSLTGLSLVSDCENRGHNNEYYKEILAPAHKQEQLIIGLRLEILLQNIMAK